MDFREGQILTTLITLGLKSELFCFCFESECEIHIVHDNKTIKRSLFFVFSSAHTYRGVQQITLTDETIFLTDV